MIVEAHMHEKSVPTSVVRKTDYLICQARQRLIRPKTFKCMQNTYLQSWDKWQHMTG